MKFIETISVFAALSAAAFAGKCGVQPPAPEYSVSSIEVVPTSSAPEYTTTVVPTGYTTSPSSSDVDAETTTTTEYPAEYYTTVVNPFSTYPMYPDGSSSASPSSSAIEYPSEYYTTVVNPFSTYPMYPDGSSSASPSSSAIEYPSEYYTTVVNPFSTYPMATETDVATPTSAPSYAYQLTLEQLNAAIPDRAGADSCGSASFPEECATNERALPAINAALQRYGVTKRGEVVAVVSLMAYESASWLYNINHWPGRAGQGTRNMQMANFNQEYASFLYPEQAAEILASAADPASDETANALRELVLNDNDSFGSGFWYLANKAKEYHDTGKIAEDSAEAFKDYVVNGVGAGWDDARQTIWETVNSGISA
ncbi:hypothetical protein LPJ56_005448 [Coemansia sp. RSA 2599]|nr:hypothetical protein LPJ75_005405 [Coemansia sp. RSA 2598]KAJ1812603.1 hypothetical protein LPJ56_005448 [Coemansia sp. RSA 2599]